MNWGARHPLLRDALRWAIPALLFGLALRALLLSYSPYAYFGADSRSYFGFAHGVLSEFYFSLNEKRRYLYPLLLLPVSALPGGPLRWLAWLQPACGILTILPMAYVVRKVLPGWRWFIVPVTAAYAGLPPMIWFEHEMLGECLFFGALVWACGGWVAWAGAVAAGNLARARRLWWWFFVPLAVALLTKPAAKFLLPAVLVGLVYVRAWRVLRWRALVAAVAVLALAATAGDDEQGVWLLYTSVFPFTQLESPAHADYKAEIRDLVAAGRANLHVYSEADRDIFLFLRGPQKQAARPLWRQVGRDERALAALHRQLALEAIAANPLGCAYLTLQKIVRSANPGEFKTERFEAAYFAERFADQYTERRTPESMIRLAFGWPRDRPLPPYGEFAPRLAPHPDAPAARWLIAYGEAYQRAAALVAEPAQKLRPIWDYRVTPFGWWLIAAAALSFLRPWRATLGVWTLAAATYLAAVFAVGTQNARYFATVWPVAILLLPLPLAVAFRVGGWLRHRGLTRRGGRPTLGGMKQQASFLSRSAAAAGAVAVAVGWVAAGASAGWAAEKSAAKAADRAAAPAVAEPAAPPAAADDAIQQKPADRIEFEKLFAMFPEGPPPWDGNAPQGKYKEHIGDQVTFARRLYTKDDPDLVPTVDISIYDYGTQAPKLAKLVGEWKGTNERGVGTAKYYLPPDGNPDIPGFFESDRGSLEHAWSFVVAGRYLLTIEMTDVHPDEFKSWIKLIDFKKLAALK